MTFGNETAMQILARMESLESTLADLRRSLANVERRVEQEVPRLHASTYRAIESLISTYRHLDSDRVLPPLSGPIGGWAISADMALLLAELLRRYRPPVVVELGSGSSTVLLGLLLREMGGTQLVSLEHDPAWYAQTLEDVHAADLGEFVDLRYAPLAPVQLGGTEYEWYSTSALVDLNEIAMVLVDGPPGYLGPHSRYPAGPLLAPRLAQGCLVVVDDFSRAEEQEMVTRWVQETDMTLLEEHTWHGKGAAVLRVSCAEVLDGA